jgi:hypothetical protein
VFQQQRPAFLLDQSKIQAKAVHKLAIQSII